MRRKGNLLLEFLLGLIIGVIVFIFLYSMANKLFFPDKEVDYEQSFDELVEKMKVVGEDDVFAADTQIMKIRDGDVIFGINPYTSNEGRLGDGNLHVIFGPVWVAQHKKTIGEKTTFMGSTVDLNAHYYDIFTADVITTIHRPPSCPLEHSCICSCTAAELVDDANFEVKEEQSYAATLDLQDFVQPQNINVKKAIQCQTLVCEDTGELTFKQYIQGDRFTGDDFLLGDLQSYEGVPFLFENGFVINRIPSRNEYEPITFGSPPDKYYTRALAEGGVMGNLITEDKFPVHFMKVVNGELAVCLSSNCFNDINEELKLYEFKRRTSSSVQTEEIGLEELLPAQSLPGAIVESCGNTNMYVSQQSKDKMWELARALSQRQYTPISIDMSDLILRDGIGQDELVVFISDGNRLQLQLYGSCGVMSRIALYAIELRQEGEGFDYDQNCESVDFVAGSTDAVRIQDIFVAVAEGSQQEQEGIPGTTVTCPSLIEHN